MDGTGVGAAAGVAAADHNSQGGPAKRHYYEDYTRGGWTWDAESRTYRSEKPLPSEAELHQRYPPPSYIAPPYYYFQESYDQKQHRIARMRHNHVLKLQWVRRRKAKVVKLLAGMNKPPSCLTESVMTRVLALPERMHLTDQLLMRIIDQCETTHKITSSLNLSVDAADGSNGLVIDTSPHAPTDADTSSSSSPRGVGDADITTIIEECADANADDKRIQLRWQPTLLLDCPECVHVLGQGVVAMVFAQSSVDPSRGGGTRTLIYFPPDATPPYDNSTARAALGESKEVLNYDTPPPQ